MAPGEVKIKQRIMGTETELAVFAPHPDDPSVTLQTPFIFPTSGRIEGIAADEMYKEISGHDFVRDFYSDGSRMYFDVGYLEYSSPELVQPSKLAANEAAAEDYVWHLVDKTNNYLEQRGVDKKFTSVLKRTLSPEKKSCGMHENYLTSAQLEFTTAAHLIAAHMLSRNIWAGGGGVLIDKNNPREVYTAGAKFSDINAYMADTTLYTGKPLINTRREPLANDRKYTRLHLTSGDGHRWPWPIFMQLSTTSLVLRLTENKRNLDGLLFDHHAEPFKAVVLDAAILDLNDPSEIAKRIRKVRIPIKDEAVQPNPLELQFRLLEACEAMAKECFVPEEEKWTLSEWRRTLEDIEYDPIQLQDRAEYIGKLVLADALGRRPSYNGKGREYPLLEFDGRWANLDPNLGIGQKGRKIKPQQNILNMAKDAPLIKTRAHVRGEIIKYLVKVLGNEQSSQIFCAVDWDEVTVSNDTLTLGNPYDNNVERMLGRVADMVRKAKKAWETDL